MDVAHHIGRAKLETRFAVDLVRAKAEHRRALGSPTRSTARSSVVANSLPKSGSHLLLKALQMLPGLARIRFQVSPALGRYLGAADSDALLVGVAGPATLSRDKLRRRLRRLPPGAFVTAHALHTRGFADMLAELGMTMIVMMRDPRDVAVSSAHYLGSHRSHDLGAAFRAKDPDGRLLASLTGVSATGAGPGLRDIRERVTSVLAWTREPFVRLVKFEDLVGAEGGGSDAAQRAALRGIADHVGVPCTDADIACIGASLFGGTHTFRSGQIGTWRSAFGREHLEAAKPLLADLLVELGYETDDRWSR